MHSLKSYLLDSNIHYYKNISIKNKSNVFFFLKTADSYHHIAVIDFEAAFIWN